MNSLTSRARQLFAPNMRLAAKWVLAVRFLRSRQNWVLEGAAPKWRGL